MSITPPSVTLRGRWAPDTGTNLLRAQTTFQEAFFLATGIIVPLMRYEQDEETDEGILELCLDGRAVASHPWTPSEEDDTFLSFWYDLVSHRLEFVVSLLVERYIDELAESFPDLIRAVRASFSVDEVMSFLRTRIGSGASIRDFRSVLEEALLARDSEFEGSGNSVGGTKASAE